MEALLDAVVALLQCAALAFIAWGGSLALHANRPPEAERHASTEEPGFAGHDAMPRPRA